MQSIYLYMEDGHRTLGAKEGKWKSTFYHSKMWCSLRNFSALNSWRRTIKTPSSSAVLSFHLGTFTPESECSALLFGAPPAPFTMSKISHATENLAWIQQRLILNSSRQGLVFWCRSEFCLSHQWQNCLLHRGRIGHKVKTGPSCRNRPQLAEITNRFVDSHQSAPSREINGLCPAHVWKF